MRATYWNGEPAECVRGIGTVLDAPDFPMFWGRKYVGQRRAVVRVTVPYYPTPFYLDNEDGSGWAKVTSGMGTARYDHRELDVADFVAEAVAP